MEQSCASIAGLHCPICANYLTDLEKQSAAFAERGYETIAISTDGLERARAMVDKVGAKNFALRL